MEKDIQQEILERLVRLETKLDNYNGLREKLDETSRANDVQDEKMRNMDKRVSDIESNQKWIWRTIIAAILAGAVTAIINFI